ncbi:MAG: hypothetical protein ACOCXQ_04430 [Patescibacteria group bacterium]
MSNQLSIEAQLQAIELLGNQFPHNGVRLLLDRLQHNLVLRPGLEAAIMGASSKITLSLTLYPGQATDDLMSSLILLDKATLDLFHPYTSSFVVLAFFNPEVWDSQEKLEEYLIDLLLLFESSASAEVGTIIGAAIVMGDRRIRLIA